MIPHQPIMVEGKRVGSFRIGVYDFQTIKGQPKIVISQVTAFDEGGNYIKHCKLEKVLPFLSQCHVEFRKAGSSE